MPEVLFAYAIAALLVAIVFVIAFVLGRAFRGNRRLLDLIGLALVAVALLEKKRMVRTPLERWLARGRLQ